MWRGQSVDDSGPSNRLEEPERLPHKMADDTLRKYSTLTKPILLAAGNPRRDLHIGGAGKLLGILNRLVPAFVD